MRLIENVLHLVVPRQSNNHKAKALHLSALTTYIVILLVVQMALTGLSRTFPQVLGYASNISIGDLLNETNNRRVGAGVSGLSLNDQLSQAAAGKASDMFTHQYWAHTSPEGKDPWDFISTAGYNFLFAGENLARDFGDSAGVVEAWMNSPSHRENLLNSRFKDVGFAVVNGKYGEDETTLVVQMFGTKAGSSQSVTPPPPAPEQTAPAPAVNTLETPPPKEPPVLDQPAEEPAATPSPAKDEAIPPTVTTELTTPGNGMILNLNVGQRPKFDITNVTKNLSVALIGALIVVLVVDSAIIYRKKAVRLSGHNLAHMLFLIAVLVALNLVGRTGLTL